jgi:hypothetical protein
MAQDESSEWNGADVADDGARAAGAVRRACGVRDDEGIERQVSSTKG